MVFRFSDLSLGWALVRSLFGCNGNPLVSFTNQIQVDSNLYLLVVAVLASTPIAKHLRRKLEERCHGSQALGTAWDILFYGVLPVVLLLLSTACLVGNSYNPFIYFQF